MFEWLSRSSCSLVDPEYELERGMRWRQLERVLAGLVPTERELLYGYAERDSISELAKRAQTGSSVLRSRMNRAPRRVRAREPGLRRILRGEV